MQLVVSEVLRLHVWTNRAVETRVKMTLPHICFLTVFIPNTILLVPEKAGCWLEVKEG